MYRFYLKQNEQQILLPVTPSELITKVEGESEKVDLVNIGESSILKDIGLRRISFTVLLPAVQYSFVQTEGTFQPPIFFLNQFRQYKMSKKPVSLIVFRKLADGTELFSGNIDVSFEQYTVLERGGEQGDFWVEINAKEYKWNFGCDICGRTTPWRVWCRAGNRYCRVRISSSLYDLCV